MSDVGTVLLPQPGPFQVPAVPNVLDPRQNMARALSFFLLDAVFCLFGQGKDASKEFQLNDVLPEWPEPDRSLDYPVASIVSPASIDMGGHNFVPTCLEETHNQFGEGTVLWKTAEAEADFQVDFWADNLPVREAIASRLPSLFNPGESRTGVVLRGSIDYFCRPVRCTLLSYQRLDNPDSAFDRERRLRTVIRCETDVVHLRCVTLLEPRIQVPEGEADGGIGELVVPQPEPETQPLDIGCGDCDT